LIQRAEEHQEIRIDRIARGVGHAHPAHSEHVAQRTAYQEIARKRRQTIADGNGLAGELALIDPQTNRHAIAIETLLEAAGLRHAQKHLLEQRFKHARRGEQICRAHLAHV
jgi:hypothetical protein